MTRIVLDSGAFLALERNDRPMWGRLERARRERFRVVTHGGVLGQVWRSGGPRQARLSIALLGVDIRPLDAELGRRAGALLARVAGDNVVDAALAALCSQGDQVYTSDPDDLVALLDAAVARNVLVVAV